MYLNPWFKPTHSNLDFLGLKNQQEIEMGKSSFTCFFNIDVLECVFWGWWRIYRSEVVYGRVGFGRNAMNHEFLCCQPFVIAFKPLMRWSWWCGISPRDLGEHQQNAAPNQQPVKNYSIASVQQVKIVILDHWDQNILNFGCSPQLFWTLSGESACLKLFRHRAWPKSESLKSLLY